MSRKLWWSFIAVLSIIILLLTASVKHIPVLTVSEQRGDQVLVIPMFHGRQFDYQYIHSVQKTPVQEHFTAAPDNQLLLTSTTYQSFGVGLPFVPGEGKLHHIDGKYLLTNLNRKFDKINIGFMALAKQGLSYNEKYYSFQDYFASGAILVLEVQDYTVLELTRGIIRRVYSD